MSTHLFRRNQEKDAEHENWIYDFRVHETARRGFD